MSSFPIHESELWAGWVKFLPKIRFNSEKGKWEAVRHFANPANGRISGIWGRRDYPATDAMQGGLAQYFHQKHRLQNIGPYWPSIQYTISIWNSVWLKWAPQKKLFVFILRDGSLDEPFSMCRCEIHEIEKGLRAVYGSLDGSQCRFIPIIRFWQTKCLSSIHN